MENDKRTITVGIDLGTTWSVIAAMDEFGKVNVITNAEGETKTPSVVLFEEDNPEAIVGKVAVNSAKAMPDRIAAFAKRDIGRQPPVVKEFDGKEYRPEELSALLLRKLKEDAELTLGGDVEVKRAVITVPAYFDMARRNATRNAGTIAGLDIIGILDEPIAAAIAFSLDEAGKDQTVVVYDLGGGTFDVTVMRIERDKVSVLAKGGNAELGGKDWDDALVRYAAAKFEEEHGDDPTDDPASYQAIYDAALMAKESLSNVNKARLVVSHGGNRTSLQITREEFDSLTANLLDQTRVTLEGILSEVPNIRAWDQVDKVLLVGGSTRMPQVRNLVSQVTGRPVEAMQDLNPDSCVARGAAMYAMGRILAISTEGNGTSPKTTEDVGLGDEVKGMLGTLGSGSRITSFQTESASARYYGIQALDDQRNPINAIMVKRNEKIPVNVTKNFGTVEANQTEIELRILESEDEERDPSKANLIIEDKIQGIPSGMPANHPVSVRFEFLEDGTLRVYAMVEFAEQEYTCELKAAPPGGMTGTELEEAKAKSAALTVV